MSIDTRPVIGVDPMNKGALVIIHPDAKPTIIDMPIAKLTNTGRTALLVPELAHLIKKINPALILIEELKPMPVFFDKAGLKRSGGALANFQRGAHLYAFHGICAALDIPLHLIPPKEWQKHYGIKGKGEGTKEASYAAACRLFPDLVDQLSRVNKNNTREIMDGRCDALLIAMIAWNRNYRRN